MKKVGICGHFGTGLNLTNGQTIKTKIVTAELQRQLGKNQVEIVDSHGGIKAVPRMLLQLFRMFRHCENVIMFPAYKGLRVFAPVFVFYNMFFHRKIHYVVIGGWLDTFVGKHVWLSGMLKKFTGIYVETATMKKALDYREFKNVVIMPNFKSLNILQPEELIYPAREPYKLCTFSRVMQEKGIEDAIQSVSKVNQKAGRVVYTLDIYGEIWKDYTDRFETLKNHFPEGISYKGVISFNKSVNVLKNYFAVLFPTRFFTEGIPGTVVDAYAAGVPVISSKWESFDDVIDNEVTGLGYEIANNTQLVKILEYVSENPQCILNMRNNCLKKAVNFTPEMGIRPLLKEIG